MNNTDANIMTTMSEVITNIIPALIDAERDFKPIYKTKRNPAFSNSKYASHDAINEAIVEALQNNGLKVMQPVQSDGDKHFVVTTVFHESGEWISSKYPLPSHTVLEYKDQRKEKVVDEWGKEKEILVKFTSHTLVVDSKDEPQKFSIGVTYARRNAIMALLNICGDEDTDGNGSGRYNSEASIDGNNNGSSNKNTGRSGTATVKSKAQPLARLNNSSSSSLPSNGAVRKPPTSTQDNRPQDNRPAKKPLSLVDCYTEIATLCSISASERDPKTEDLVSDPNHFNNEVMNLAAQWSTKTTRLPVKDMDAFSEEFWGFMAPVMGNDSSTESFLQAFKQWQDEVIASIKHELASF